MGFFTEINTFIYLCSYLFSMVEGCEMPGCQGKATNFHSKCCNSHFEGVIKEDGRWAITCEECGKFVAYLEK
jgi:hypothetical protein